MFHLRYRTLCPKRRLCQATLASDNALIEEHQGLTKNLNAVMLGFAAEVDNPYSSTVVNRLQ